MSEQKELKLGKYVVVIEAYQEGLKEFGLALEKGIKHSGYKCKYYRFDNIISLEEV